MKKVFLVFGIFSFAAASAQENEVFDIQQHLLQKQANEKKAAEQKLPALPFTKPFTYVNPYTGNDRADAYHTDKGDRVIQLGQDHMPCVQPDMRQFRVMPNLFYDKPFNYASKRPEPGQIPNGSLPYRMIVTR